MVEDMDTLAQVMEGAMETPAPTTAPGFPGSPDGGGTIQSMVQVGRTPRRLTPTLSLIGSRQRVALERNIEEMKRHVEEGTVPATWPTQPFPYNDTGAYAPSPEQEKKLLEGQMTAISSQMDAIKKRLEEIKEGD